jgi:hypothetical protein
MKADDTGLARLLNCPRDWNSPVVPGALGCFADVPLNGNRESDAQNGEH